MTTHLLELKILYKTLLRDHECCKCSIVFEIAMHLLVNALPINGHQMARLRGK